MRSIVVLAPLMYSRRSRMFKVHTRRATRVAPLVALLSWYILAFYSPDRLRYRQSVVEYRRRQLSKEFIDASTRRCCRSTCTPSGHHLGQTQNLQNTIDRSETAALSFAISSTSASWMNLVERFFDRSDRNATPPGTTARKTAGKDHLRLNNDDIRPSSGEKPWRDS